VGLPLDTPPSRIAPGRKQCPYSLPPPLQHPQAEMAYGDHGLEFLCGRLTSVVLTAQINPTPFPTKDGLFLISLSLVSASPLQENPKDIFQHRVGDRLFFFTLAFVTSLLPFIPVSQQKVLWRLFPRFPENCKTTRTSSSPSSLFGDLSSPPLPFDRPNFPQR